MGDWVVCPACRLRHTRRADSLCPRCHGVMPIGPGSSVSGLGPPLPEPRASARVTSPVSIPAAPAPAEAPPPAPADSTSTGPGSGPPGLCQVCQAAGPTHYVEFQQNVGLLVLRLHRTLKGHLCARCVREQFSSMTTVTFFGGWWGIVSFFLTPVILIANVIQYQGAKQAFRDGKPGWAPAAPGASLPQGDGHSTPAAPGSTPQLRKGLATASLVLGVLGMLCAGLFGVVPLAAIVLGFVALNKVSRQPEQYGGRGLALGGIATGGVGLAVSLAIVAVAWLGATAPQRSPAETAFNEASRRIDVYSDEEAFGNAEEARAMARRFSRVMKSVDKLAFSGQDDSGPSLSQGHFLTYVELRQDGVCFLVHVPQLRAYDGDVRRTLLDLAWAAAKEASEEVRKDRDLRLGVGLRGAVAYGAVATGMGEGKPQQELGRVVSTTPLEAFFSGPAWTAPLRPVATALPEDPGQATARPRP